MHIWWIVGGILILSVLKCEGNTFVQITDLHFEWDYVVGSNPSDGYTCFKGKGDAGVCGDYNCDVPYAMYHSAIQHFRSENPDFVLWTGDVVPHDSSWVGWNKDKLLWLIQNVTNEISSSFPGVPVFPLLGNHDAIPCHTITPGPNWLLDGAAEIWKNFFSKEMHSDFSVGGFYTTTIAPGFRLIVLNTVFYYNQNEGTKGMPDPAGQLKWLSKTLDAARSSREKVLIVGHVPPGFKEEGGGSEFYEDFNSDYYSAFEGSNDIIVGHIYGHLHTDSFRLMVDSSGMTGLFLTGSVDEWDSINPQMRVWHYDPESFELLDFDQYFVNLTECNTLKDIQWKKEYSPKEEFGIENLKGESVMKWWENMKDSETLLQKYWSFNRAGAPTKICDAECEKTFLCALRYVNESDYTACLS